MSFYEKHYEEIPSPIYLESGRIAHDIALVPPRMTPGRQKLELQQQIWELDREIGTGGLSEKIAELEAHKEELQRQYKTIK